MLRSSALWYIHSSRSVHHSPTQASLSRASILASSVSSHSYSPSLAVPISWSSSALIWAWADMVYGDSVDNRTTEPALLFVYQVEPYFFPTITANWFSLRRELISFRLKLRKWRGNFNGVTDLRSTNHSALTPVPRQLLIPELRLSGCSYLKPVTLR